MKADTKADLVTETHHSSPPPRKGILFCMKRNEYEIIYEKQRDVSKTEILNLHRLLVSCTWERQASLFGFCCKGTVVSINTAIEQAALTTQNAVQLTPNLNV